MTTSIACLRRARLHELAEAICADAIALRDAQTSAERDRIQKHVAPLIDERNMLLGRVAA